jgi:hypothetical protein
MKEDGPEGRAGDRQSDRPYGGTVGVSRIVGQGSNFCFDIAVAFKSPSGRFAQSESVEALRW